MARKIRTWLFNLQVDFEPDNRLRLLLEKANRIDSKLPTLLKHLRHVTSIIPLSPPRLTVQALGKAQVKLNGRTVTMTQWQTHAVHDLFFYFLNVSQKISKEEIGAAFWPEASPAQLKIRFKNNIFRLRRALGQDTIIFDNEHYQFNYTLDYEYDVETFESYLVQARSTRDIHEQIACYEAAIRLIRGRYLENIDAQWILIERERLNQLYLIALLRLAELYREIGNPQKALQACQRAIAYDACLEEAYRSAMRIYASIGDRAAVARQYQTCKENLHNELDIPPSPETEKLYQELTA
jgi:two-component SAPR family response regulator